VQPHDDDDDAGQSVAGTGKIPTGDDAKTAVLVLESLPAGSSVAFAGGQRVLAGEDGRATVPLGPGTHEIEVTDPSGGSNRKTVTITDQELGSFKTVAIDAAPRSTAAAGAERDQRYAQPEPAQTRKRAAGPVAPPVATAVKRSTGKIVAAAISVAIFAALAVAAIIVIRGPGKAPQQQASVDPNAVAAAPTPSQTPEPQPSADLSAGAASPTPTPSANKNAAASRDETKKENSQQALKPIEEESPKPGRNLHETSPVTVPSPTPTPAPAVTRPIDETDTDGGTCLIVIVSGPAGNPVPGARVSLTDEPSIYQGITGLNGRWRRCGLTPGHRVMVRVFKGGNMIGAKQDVLTAGRNFIGVQIQQQVDPYSESSRPGRKPGLWQRQP